MTEELRLRLSVDTASLKRSVNEAKKSIQAINKPTGKSNTTGVKKLNIEFTGLKDTLQSIKNLNFIEFIRGFSFDGIRKQLAKLKTEMKTAFAYIPYYVKAIGNSMSGGFGIDFTNLKDSFIWVFEDIKDTVIDVAKAIHNRSGGFKNIFKSGFNDVKTDAKGVVSSVGSIFKKLTPIVGAVGVALKASFSAVLVALKALIPVIGAIIVGFTLMARSAIKVAKATAKIANEAHRIGMSVSSYQKWGYVMQQVGGDASDLTDFIRTLSSEQVKAREGNEETIKSFQKLGIEAGKLQTMGQQELFEETVKGLARVEDQVERTSLAYKIFGEEDAPKLTNLLALNNQQIAQMVHNYEMLGGYATPALTENSMILNGSLNNLSVAWQGVKNVLAEAVLPTVISVVNWLVKATAVVRMFLGAIFNVDLGKVSKTTSSAGASMDNYSSSVKSATGAIEKLKRSVMGFDELNIMTDDDVGGSGGGDIGVNVPAPSMNIPDLENIFPTPEDLGLDDISAWFEENKTVIEDWATGLTMALGIIMAIAGFATGNIPMGIAGIGLAGLGVAVGMGEGGTWERLFGAIGEGATSLWNTISTGAKETWDAIVGFFSPAFTWINENIIQPVANVISKVASWIYNNIVEPIAEYGKNIWDMISSIATNIYNHVKDIIVGIIEAIIKIYAKIYEIFSKVVEIAMALGKAFYDYVIKPIVDFVVSCAKWIYDKAIKPIIDFFIDLGKKAYTYIIKPLFDKVLWLKNKVVSIFKTIGNFVVDFIGGSIKSVINGVFWGIENSINFFIGMLNGAVGIINKIPGVNISYIEEINLPRLATGGIATKSTIANIGENGKEAILPLENNTGWMELLANKLASKQKTPSKIILNLDGRELGWASIDNINAITEQTGGIQLVL